MTIQSNSIKSRLDSINKRIKDAALVCGREPENIKLVAVSKTKSADIVKNAIQAGAHILGENYIQEACDKIEMLSEYKDVSWHFIGHLQTNKAKYAVKFFDLIHSVDSVKLAKEIDKQAQKIEKIQKILIQVNIGMETTKYGTTIDKTLSLIKDISQFKNISVQGLMAMPPYFNDPEKTRPFFSQMKKLQKQIRNLNIDNILMDELSMGMTSDFETAIQEGATIVRVGTAIFGERS